ncbi:MAG: tetratricopeptide repeat protein [Chloroflexota bacterium]
MSEQTSFTPTLALHYLHLGQANRVLELTQNASEKQVDTFLFWYIRAQAFHELDKYRDGRSAAQKGLALSPNNPTLLYVLANCEAGLDNLAAAEKAILAILRNNPENVQALCRYAIFVLKAQQREKAEKLIERAAQINPEHPTIARMQTLLAYVDADDKRAANLSREVIAQDPDDLYGHRMLGHSLAAQGRVRDSKQHFDQAARMDPMNDGVTDAARHSRYQNHWLMWPLRLIQRVGRIQIWLGFIVLYFGLRALGQTQLLGIIAISYLVLVIYSWVVPPLLRRWLQRSQGNRFSR